MMDIGVAADGAVVTLTGTVSSRAERQAAQDAARRVAGVVDVANRIQVEVPGGKEEFTCASRTS